jgi:hypothetical protein
MSPFWNNSSHLDRNQQVEHTMANQSGNGIGAGTVVSWQNGMGDDRKYHIAHVSTSGITLVCRMKDHARWQEAVAAASRSPEQAVALLKGLPQAVEFASAGLAKVTHAPDLWQLVLIDRNGKRKNVPEGREQTEVFNAIRQHLGGDASDEEADVWSVIKTPLFVVSVFGAIGGFFVYFTTICTPDYDATGRRQGMKQLMNSLGYKIGPIWASVALAALLSFVLFGMVRRLIKRPIRQVLTFSG